MNQIHHQINKKLINKQLTINQNEQKQLQFLYLIKCVQDQLIFNNKMRKTPKQKYINQDFSSTITTGIFQSGSKRAPHFQRKSSRNKCDRSSIQRRSLSSDSSISKFYVKKQFINAVTPQKFVQNVQVHPYLCKIDDKLKTNFSYLQQPMGIQNNNDNQFQNISIVKSFKQKSTLDQFQSSTIFQNKNYQPHVIQDINLMLKKIIFYKEKCQKMARNQKQLNAQHISIQNINKKHIQQNEKLKKQVDKLEKILSNSNQKTISKKMRDQYKQFRKSSQIQSKYIVEKQSLQTKINELSQQNCQLRSQIKKQAQIFGLKLKQMQQKQFFLQSLLKTQKHRVSKLQTQTQRKTIQQIQSKRSIQLVQKKQKQIQTLRTKYENLMNAIKGKPTQQTSKYSSDKNKPKPSQISRVSISRSNNFIEKFKIKQNLQIINITHQILPLTHDQRYKSSRISQNNRKNIVQQHLQRKNLQGKDNQRMMTRNQSNLSQMSLQFSPQKQRYP